MVMTKYFPGTRMPISEGWLLSNIFDITSGITLSQVCEITGLEAGAIHNWISRGYLNPPLGRKYTKKHVARIIIINMLRETLSLEKIANVLSYINGDLLDSKDDLMDESDIYQCLCDILIPAEEKEVIDIGELFVRIDRYLSDFVEPYQGAKKKLELVLKIIMCAWESSYFKRYAQHLASKI